MTRNTSTIRAAPTEELASQTAARRLEVIGQLTGGIAHDFNNLLTVIMAATEHLAAGLEEGSDQHELAVAGLRAAERGAELVRRLLAPSRQQARRPEAIDCNAMIQGVASMIRRTLGPDIELDVRLPAHPVRCLADDADLASALMNLCGNARDAMSAGGKLALAVDRVLLSKTAAECLALRAGPYAALSVCDTGVGMSAATLKQATQPFFTTKGQAGTGLGLANADAFARESGGHLAIVSRQDAGTTATLYLPLVRDAVRTAPADVWLLEAPHVS